MTLNVIQKWLVSSITVNDNHDWTNINSELIDLYKASFMTGICREGIFSKHLLHSCQHPRLEHHQVSFHQQNYH